MIGNFASSMRARWRIASKNSNSHNTYAYVAR